MQTGARCFRIPAAAGGAAWASAILLAAGSAAAGVIDDRGFFDPHPHTTIDFESRGDGSPLSLIDGQTLAMPADEYASQGVTFSPHVHWVNDGNAAFDAAQFLGGSPVVAIPSAQVDVFDIIFGVPVRAVGMFVVNNRDVDPNGPVFTAYDAGGAIIGTAAFGAPFIDGSMGIADYGFMGILAGQDIARLSVSKDAAILDDLIFSPVPAPAAASLLALAAAAHARRRR